MRTINRSIDVVEQQQDLIEAPKAFGAEANLRIAIVRRGYFLLNDLPSTAINSTIFKSYNLQVRGLSLLYLRSGHIFHPDLLFCFFLTPGSSLALLAVDSIHVTWERAS